MTTSFFGQLAGTLDLSFNGVGYKWINTADLVTGTSFFNYSSTIQSDGKILLAGGNNYNNSFESSVLRLNVDGSIDTTFGVNGFYNRSTSDYNYDNCALAQQSEGKIVYASRYVVIIGGTQFTKICVLRINSDGTTDNSFGINGQKIVDINPFNYVTCLKIQNDGKILIAGNSGDDYVSFSVLRLMPNGDVDTSFGNNGMTPSINGSIPGVTSIIYAMDILPSGKIICSGVIYQTNNTFDNFCIVRYNSEGSIDTTFDSNGIVIIPVEIGGDSIKAQAIQPDGKIVVAGYANAGSINYLPIMRLNANGTIDTTFGTNGLVSQFIADAPYAKFTSMALQPDGKIVLVGDSPKSFIIRFNADGSLDTTFNIIGYNVCDFNPDPSYINAGFDSVFVLADGMILATGKTDFLNGIWSSYYSTVAKFNSGLNLSQESFNKTDIKLFPNPTFNESFFDNSSSQFNELEIFNALGQKVANQKLLFTSNQEIDLSNFSAGIYIVKLSNENNSVSIKIIKE